MRADDRYTWLDGKAAERLLSGAPAGGPSAEGTTPLAAVLGELAAVRTAAATAGRTFSPDAPVPDAPAPDASAPGDGELPGEAAALAAFRAARLRAPDDGGVGARPGRRSPRVRVLGRPLRAGIATAALGCVLGGVAVAAGTGALPAPFGRGSDAPSPMSSVSSAAPGDGGSPLPVPGIPYGDHWRNGERGDAARNGGSPDAPDTPDDSGSGDRTADPGPSAAGTTGGGAEGAAGRDGARDRTGAAVLCERHAADRLDEAGRARLERVAGGPGKVVDYCRRHGGPENGSGGGSGSPGGNPASGGASANGGANGGGSSDSSGSSGSSSSGSSGSPGSSGGTGGGPPAGTGDPPSGGKSAPGGTSEPWSPGPDTGEQVTRR